MSAVAQAESLPHLYADALLELAFEKGVHAEILSELNEFGRVLAQEEQFRDFLNTPFIRQDAKKDVIKKVFGGQISDHTLHFLLVVIDKRRQQWLGAIIEAFEAGYHERMGELVVRVESAVALSNNHRDRLRKTLRQRYDKDIILRERVNEKLIGGLVLWVGDSRIDGSLRTRLRAIESKLETARFTSEDYYAD